jgi:three-Cys-motif partner protein
MPLLFLFLFNRMANYLVNPVTFSADDFSITAIEPWFKVKVQVIKEYLQAFTLQTTGLADEIIFLDLQAGSGFYSLGAQKQLVPMPSLEALRVDPPFHKVILCEENPEYAKALKVRVNKYFRQRNVLLFEEDVNSLIRKLHHFVPPSKRNHKVAPLCLVDPHHFSISFSLIEQLANLGFSFIIPYTFPLNNRLNYKHYQREVAQTVQSFVGPNVASVMTANTNTEFYKKLVRSHQNNLLTLGMQVSLSAHKSEYTQMDVPVFYVGMYSKLVSAKEIVKDVKVSGIQQTELF